MQTFEIKSRWDGRVLYSASGESLRDVVERAVHEGADLSGANLRNAYLRNAYLSDANLRNANLRNANLSGAYLSGANLRNAYLSDANLIDANLSDANLSGAYLSGANLRNAYLSDANLSDADDNKLVLTGDRPILTIGPLGSRSDYLTAYTTNAGVYVRAGCFFDSLAAFRLAVSETHGDSIHGREYAVAVAMIEAHAAIWTPATVAEAA